jgi:hypothetical protein
MAAGGTLSGGTSRMTSRGICGSGDAGIDTDVDAGPVAVRAIRGRGTAATDSGGAVVIHRTCSRGGGAFAEPA